jgi:hypothetical protein
MKIPRTISTTLLNESWRSELNCGSCLDDDSRHGINQNRLTAANTDMIANKPILSVKSLPYSEKSSVWSEPTKIQALTTPVNINVPTRAMPMVENRLVASRASHIDL